MSDPDAPTPPEPFLARRREGPRKEDHDEPAPERSPLGTVNRKDVVGLLVTVVIVVIVAWLLRTFGGY